MSETILKTADAARYLNLADPLSKSFESTAEANFHPSWRTSSPLSARGPRRLARRRRTTLDLRSTRERGVTGWTIRKRRGPHAVLTAASLGTSSALAGGSTFKLLHSTFDYKHPGCCANTG